MNLPISKSFVKCFFIILLMWALLAIYFTIFGLVPQLIGLSISKEYLNCVYFFAPICTTLPTLIIARKKLNQYFPWSIKWPDIKTLFILVGLSITTLLLASYFNYPFALVKNLFIGKIKCVHLNVPLFDSIFIIRLLGSILLTPIIEEFLFRRLILDLLIKSNKLLISLLYSSFLFAISHSNLNSILPLFILGLILGYVYYYTQSLGSSIILHSLSNLGSHFVKYEFFDISVSRILYLLVFMIVGIFIILCIIRYFYSLSIAKMAVKDGQ